MMLVDTKIKKREQITSLTFLRYRQTPNHLKRVKAHAIRREPSTFVLDDFLLIWRFSETRIKADASQYVCYISTVMLPYAVRFRVLHYWLFRFLLLNQLLDYRLYFWNICNDSLPKLVWANFVVTMY